jgi:hypothetical protein
VTAQTILHAIDGDAQARAFGSAVGDVGGDGVIGAAGYAGAALPIPANPLLVGQTFHAQAVWTWAGTCGGPPPHLACSNGLSLTVQ